MPAAKWLSSLYCRDFYIVLQYLLNSFWALLTSKLSFSAVCRKQKPLQIPYQAMEAIAGTLCNAILLFRNKRNIEQFFLLKWHQTQLSSGSKEMVAGTLQWSQLWFQGFVAQYVGFSCPLPFWSAAPCNSLPPFICAITRWCAAM